MTSGSLYYLYSPQNGQKMEILKITIVAKSAHRLSNGHYELKARTKTRKFLVKGNSFKNAEKTQMRKLTTVKSISKSAKIRTVH